MGATVSIVSAALIAGAASSAGPCAAPRFALIGMLSGARSSVETIRASALFVAGLACVYASFGAAASWLAHAIAWSTAIYCLLAAVLVANALRSILQPPRPKCETRAPSRNRGGAFVLGASSALVVSPCCTPFAVAAAASAAAGNAPLSGAEVLAAFAVGHCLPIVAAATTVGRFVRWTRWCPPREATSLISGGVMLALGSYYAVLA